MSFIFAHLTQVPVLYALHLMIPYNVNPLVGLLSLKYLIADNILLTNLSQGIKAIKKKQ